MNDTGPGLPGDAARLHLRLILTIKHPRKLFGVVMIAGFEQTSKSLKVWVMKHKKM